MLQAIEGHAIIHVHVDVEHHGHQGDAAGFAGDVQLAQQRAEGVLLVVKGIEHRGAPRLEVFGEADLLIDAAAQGQQVDTVAHEVLHVQVALASGGEAHDEVGVASKLVEQEFEGGEQGGDEAGPGAGGHLLQSAHHCGWKFEVEAFAPVGLLLGTRPVGGQVQALQRTFEEVGPVALHFIVFGALRQVEGGFAVGAEGHGGRQVCWLACLARIVQGAHLGHHDAQAPAIAHHVVSGQSQQVGVGVELQQACAEQGTLTQVVRTEHIGLQQFRLLRFALGSRQGAQVGVGQLHCELFRHDHAGPGGTKRGAQRHMAVHQLLHRALQRRTIERTREFQAHTLVVRAGGFHPHLRCGEHFALRLGGGNGLLDHGSREGVVFHGDEARIGDESFHARDGL